MSGRGPDHRQTLRVFQELADADVVEALRTDRCTGWRWEVVRTRESATALNRVRWLLRSEHLTRRTRELGRGVVLDEQERWRLYHDDHERDGIAVDAVAHGIEVFRRYGVLDPAGRSAWRPGGASLTTFVTNACIRELSPAVARWRSEHRWRSVERPVGDHDRLDRPDPVAPPVPGTFDEVLDADPEIAALVDAKPRLREALALRYETGAEWGAIASRLEIGLPTLRGRKDQLRRELRRLLDERRTDPDRESPGRRNYELEGGGRP